MYAMPQQRIVFWVVGDCTGGNSIASLEDLRRSSVSNLCRFVVVMLSQFRDSL